MKISGFIVITLMGATISGLFTTALLLFHIGIVLGLSKFMILFLCMIQYLAMIFLISLLTTIKLKELEKKKNVRPKTKR